MYAASANRPKQKVRRLRDLFVLREQDWHQLSRRTDLQSKIDGHLEYARFLKFVRENIVRKRRYRLALSDMSLLEIMPKGRYW